MNSTATRIDEANAIVTRDAFTGKWIICREIGDSIESDELGRRRGQWDTRDEAVAACREFAKLPMVW